MSIKVSKDERTWPLTSLQKKTGGRERNSSGVDRDLAAESQSRES